MQIAILPVADRHLDYAASVASRLQAAGYRARVDTRSESVGRKVRDAELARLPFMVVVGDEEEGAGTVAARSHDEGEIGTLAVEDLVERLDALASPTAG